MRFFREKFEFGRLCNCTVKRYFLHSFRLKQKGVVGAVMALKHMATTESDSQEDIPSSSSTDGSHLSERAGRAKDLLGKLILFLLYIMRTSSR
jgi:hypothetical protein